MVETNKADRIEDSRLMGEIAAQRLHALIQERFDELRELYGVKQCDVAQRIGVPEQQLSRWLAEPRNMQVKSAGRLLAGLDTYLRFDLERFEDLQKGNCIGAATRARVPKVLTSPGSTSPVGSVFVFQPAFPRMSTATSTAPKILDEVQA